MQLQETVCFENTSSLDDPIFSGPAGKLSVRQAIILGIGCAPILLYSLSTFNFIILPLIIIPLIIGLPRPKIIPMDQLVLSLILFYINGGIKPKKVKKNVKKEKSNSKHLGIKALKIFEKKLQKVEIRKFKIADYAKPINLKLDLHKPDGIPFENRFVEIYLDEKRVAGMTTDGIGQIVATFIPENPGEKRLKIYADKLDTPVLDEIISFEK